MKNLALLGLLWLACGLALGLVGYSASAQESPLPPPGLEGCPLACIEYYAEIGRPTCNSWCVTTRDLNVAVDDSTDCALARIKGTDLPSYCLSVKARAVVIVPPIPRIIVERRWPAVCLNPGAENAGCTCFTDGAVYCP